VKVVPPLAFVLTALVRIDALAAAAALAAADMVRCIETWESPELINCKMRTSATGTANVRNKARH